MRVKVMRSLGKQVCGEDFLHNATHPGKRQTDSDPLSLGLEKVVRDRGEHDVVMPSGERAPLEMIETELGLEVLILLLDRPALMRQADDLDQRRRRRQIDEIEFGAWRGADIALD